MGKITVIRPNGTKTSVDEESFPRLEALGYKRETQEEAILRREEEHTSQFYDTPGQKVKTTLEGVASGLTVGLIDPLITDEDTRQRAARNSAYRIGGEIVGAMAPIILSAGAAAPESATITGGKIVAKMAAKTPAGAVARVGTNIGGLRGAAVEGAIFGAGSSVTRAELSGDPLTAESVIAHVGAGTLLSVGAGAAAEGLIGLGRLAKKTEAPLADTVIKTEDDVLSAFYKGLPKEKKPRKSDIPEWLKSESVSYVDRDKVVAEVTRQTSSIRPETYSQIRSSVDDFLKEQRAVAGDLDGALKLAQKQAREYSRQVETGAADLRTAVGSTRKELLSNAGKGKDDLSQLEKELEAAIKTERQLSKGKAAREIIDAAEENVDKLSKRVESMKNSLGETRLGDAQKAKINTDFDSLEAGYRSVRKAAKENDPVKAMKSLEEFRRSIKESPYFAGARGSALPPELDPEIAFRTRDALRAAEEAVTRNQAAAVLHGFPKTADDFFKMSPNKAEKVFAAMEKIKLSPEIKPALKELGLDSGDIRNLWSEGKAAKKFTTSREYVDRAKFNLKEDIPDVEPRGTSWDKPAPPKAEWPEITATDDVYKTVSSKSTYQKPHHATTFWQDAVRAISTRFAAHEARAAGFGLVGGALAYELVGNAFTGGMLGGIVGMGSGVAGRIRGAVSKYAPSAGKGLRRLAPRIEPLSVRIDGSQDATKDRHENFNKRVEEIRSIGPTFNDALFHAVEPFVGEQPAFASAVLDSASKAFMALQQFVPRDPGLAFSRLKSLWKPTDIEMLHFERAYAVYHDPVGTIEAVLSTGSVDSVTVAALREMYPSLYNSLQQAMTLRLMDSTFLNSLSYADQGRLSILLDIPIHSSFSSRSIAATQAMYLNTKKPSPPAPSNSGGRPAKSEPPTPGQSLLNM